MCQFFLSPVGSPPSSTNTVEVPIGGLSPLGITSFVSSLDMTSVLVTYRLPRTQTRSVCHGHLHHIQCIKESTQQNIPCCLVYVNAQSSQNKTDAIMAYLKENDLDVFVVTESWLQTTYTKARGDLKPLGYDLKDESRDEWQGGRVAIIQLRVSVTRSQ